MALEPQSAETFDFIAGVAQRYAKLIESARADRESGLGGQLFYAGTLDGEGRMLVAAANIAGAATLAASADRAAQKQAIRDGIADFLVNSLDEALRILKNQLRKRQTVAVCVGLAPEAVEREMHDRGVEPDLVRRDVTIAPGHQALLIQDKVQAESDLRKIPALVTWSVASAPAQWLPKLDAIALECVDTALGADVWMARRWLLLAPRFLGRLAQGLHLLDCDREVAARFVEQVKKAAQRGEIAVVVEIRSHFSGVHDERRFAPDKS